jgi:hypothetical protein
MKYYERWDVGIRVHDSEAKQQSSQWKSMSSWRPQKARRSVSNVQDAFSFLHLTWFYVLYVFRRGHEVNQLCVNKFHIAHFHTSNQQVNTTVQQVGIDSLWIYLTILRRLREVVRKELLAVWQEQLVSATRESCRTHGALSGNFKRKTALIGYTATVQPWSRTSRHFTISDIESPFKHTFISVTKVNATKAIGQLTQSSS